MLRGGDLVHFQRNLSNKKKICFKSLEMNDSLSTTQILLEDIHFMQKQYHEPLAEFEKSVTLDPLAPKQKNSGSTRGG